MTEEITQEEIDRENDELFNENRVLVSMTDAINLEDEDEAWAAFTRYCALAKCRSMLERKVLIALSAIVSVRDGMLVASVSERDNKLITTCLEITNREYEEAVEKLEEHKLIVGTDGDDVLISDWPSHYRSRSDEQLIRLEVNTESKRENDKTTTNQSTSMLCGRDDD